MARRGPPSWKQLSPRRLAVAGRLELPRLDHPEAASRLGDEARARVAGLGHRGHGRSVDRGRVSRITGVLFTQQSRKFSSRSVYSVASSFNIANSPSGEVGGSKWASAAIKSHFKTARGLFAI